LVNPRAPGEVQIKHKPGYAGTGAQQAWFVGALVLFGMARRIFTVQDTRQRLVDFNGSRIKQKCAQSGEAG
jgi:hypothetical protein